jgi:hypothetical protein
MIQLAWRFLMFQKDSTLAHWFRARTESARGTRKAMIVAFVARQSGWEHSDNQDGHFGGRSERMIVAARR